MFVIFRVDSNKKLGLGHLSRCLSIAKYLKIKKITCIFIVSHNSIINLKNYDFKIIKIKTQQEELSTIQKLIKKNNCHILVIDSKKKSISKLISKFRNKTKIVTIDNILTKNVDLLILPGVKEQFSNYPKKALVGSKYALLNPHIISIKNPRPNNSLLLSMGGSDKYNITTSFVKAFRKIKTDFKLIIVLGKFNDQDKKIQTLIKNDKRFVLLKDPKHFPRLLASSLLGIISFGITVYEVAASGLPAVVVSHTNENDIAAKKVERYGWFKYLGKYDHINYFNGAQKIIQISKNKTILRKMKRKGKVIDVKGSERVANALLKLLKT